MLNNKFPSLLIVLLFAFSACTNMANADEDPIVEEPAMSQEEVKAYIEAMEDTLAMAYNQKDVSLFEKFYGEGAVTYGEGREQIFGRSNIINHFRKNVAENPNYHAQFKYHTIDVFAQGDLATETGKWVENDSTGTETSHGFYVVVFKKIDDRYVSIRDMWNSSVSSKGNTEETTPPAD
jgi:ketosteroid isomerase-like protein